MTVDVYIDHKLVYQVVIMRHEMKNEAIERVRKSIMLVISEDKKIKEG